MSARAPAIDASMALPKVLSAMPSALLDSAASIVDARRHDADYC